MSILRKREVWPHYFLDPQSPWESLDTFKILIGTTVRMISTARFSGHILLLHHYKRNLAHISDFDSLVLGLLKSER